jgi:hypothetical protein
MWLLLLLHHMKLLRFPTQHPEFSVAAAVQDRFTWGVFVNRLMFVARDNVHPLQLADSESLSARGARGGALHQLELCGDTTNHICNTRMA